MGVLNVFETIGLIWVMLTSAMATVGFFYCAYVGFVVMTKHEGDEVRVRVLPVTWGDQRVVKVTVPTNFR